MNILVTGTKGFIGKAVADFLENSKNVIYRYDIKDGYVRPRQLKQIEQCDWVIHIGAISSTTETNIEKIIDLNVSWPIELFEMCVERGINFQWSSSASLYRNDFNENAETFPRSLYARSKDLLETYIQKRETKIIKQGFRYFNVYGKGEDCKQGQASPFYTFEKQAIETGTVKVFEGSESFHRDFVPIDLVCSYHSKFLNKSVSGIFNIGTGKTQSFLSIAKQVSSKHNARIEEIEFPTNLKDQYQSYTCADMNKTINTLGEKLEP